MRGGVQDVRRHPFFSKLNWSRLERRALKPPFVPQLSGPDDVSAFECENLEMPPNHFTGVATRTNDHLFENF